VSGARMGRLQLGTVKNSLCRERKIDKLMDQSEEEANREMQNTAQNLRWFTELKYTTLLARTEATCGTERTYRLLLLLLQRRFPRSPRCDGMSSLVCSSSRQARW
jgi:hypothetical protein